MKLTTYEVEFKVTATVSAADLDDAHGEADVIGDLIMDLYGVETVNIADIKEATE
jgi:hypothetical protein